MRQKENLTENSNPDTKILDNLVNLSSKFDIKEKTIFKPKFYINKNNKDMKGSGGVEVFNTNNLKDCIVRLSISPSQGDDPGFKSRPEHLKSSLSSKVQVKDTIFTILPNSLRNIQQQDLWLNYKDYLIAQRQSKKSI